MFRTLSAFIIAPFPVACFQAIVVGLWPKVGKGIFEHPASMFIAIALYFYFFGLLLGVPLWLLRRRTVTLRTFTVTGTVVGLVPAGVALLVLILRGRGSAYVVIYDLLLFGLGGAVAGALFWRVALRKKSETKLAETIR